MKTKIRGVFFLALMAAACNDTSDTDTESLTYEAALSDCGGFDSTVERSNYCDAEIAKWEYDSSSKTLVFSDNRIMLNCCGEHDLTASFEDGVYVITEHDAPEVSEDGAETRCKCTCPFDYEIRIQNVTPSEASLRLVRNVTDDEQWTNRVVWEGTLDLTEESGEFVIDDRPAEFGCGNTK